MPQDEILKDTVVEADVSSLSTPLKPNEDVFSKVGNTVEDVIHQLNDVEKRVSDLE